MFAVTYVYECMCLWVYVWVCVLCMRECTHTYTRICECVCARDFLYYSIYCVVYNSLWLTKTAGIVYSTIKTTTSRICPYSQSRIKKGIELAINVPTLTYIYGDGFKTAKCVETSWQWARPAAAITRFFNILILCIMHRVSAAQTMWQADLILAT